MADAAKKMSERDEKKRKARNTFKEKVKSDSDVKPGPNYLSNKLASFWKDQIEDYERINDKFIRMGNRIIKRFRDERNAYEEDVERRMATLWANFKILKPAVYGKCPLPIADRKFLDKDPNGRLSSMMLERGLRNEIQDNNYHGNVSRAVNDYLLPGRGVVWVRYEPEIGQGPSLPISQLSTIEDQLETIYEEDGKSNERQSDKDEKLEETNEILLAESAPVDYIDWKDFGMLPVRARTWAEVQSIYKRVYLTKEECTERFGEEIAEDMKPDTTPYGDSNKRSNLDISVFQDINERNIVVYEIWNKTDRKVYWVSPGYDYLCDIKKDPLQLKNFFPVPEPISATLTNDNMWPVPDYIEYQDQAVQIDELTKRIAMLSKACKVAGTYDASNSPLARLLNETVENQLIPVDQWAMYAEKGGVKGAISFLPIAEIQQAIETLTQVRQNVMQDLDLITGISDIVRGTTDSRETLGGIRLKNNNAGTRLSDRQYEVARFARDVVRLVAEVMCKHFSDETLIKISGILYEEELQPEFIKKQLEELWEAQQPQQPQQPQQLQQLQQLQQPQLQSQGNIVPFPQQPNMPPPQPDFDKMANDVIEKRVQAAIDLLRDEIERGYRIDIETDSTIFGDAMQERQDAIEFIAGVTGFMEKATVLGQAVPEFIPVAGRMLQFGVRKFRTGRDLEASIDAFVRKIDDQVKNIEKNGKSPSIEEQKLQVDLQMKQQEMQHKVQLQQAEQQAQRENDIRDAQKAQMEDQRQQQINQMEMSIAQQKHNMEIRKMQMEMQIKEREFEMKMAEMQADVQLKQQEHVMQTEQMHSDHALEQERMANEAYIQDREMQNQEKLANIKQKQVEHKVKMGDRKIKQDEKKQFSQVNKQKGKT
jgi:hypothetical protein